MIFLKEKHLAIMLGVKIYKEQYVKQNYSVEVLKWHSYYYNQQANHEYYVPKEEISMID